MDLCKSIKWWDSNFLIPRLAQFCSKAGFLTTGWNGCMFWTWLYLQLSDIFLKPSLWLFVACTVFDYPSDWKINFFWISAILWYRPLKRNAEGLSLCRLSEQIYNELIFYCSVAEVFYKHFCWYWRRRSRSTFLNHFFKMTWKICSPACNICPLKLLLCCCLLLSVWAINFAWVWREVQLEYLK